MLIDIELSSPTITNTISFPRTTTIGSITLPCVNNTCKYHFNVCIGMQCVGTLSSYLWGYKTTSSANITSMNAYECNAYVLCLHTSKGMKPHRTPSRATYDAKLYRYGRTIRSRHNFKMQDGWCDVHVMPTTLHITWFKKTLQLHPRWESTTYIITKLWSSTILDNWELILPNK